MEVTLAGQEKWDLESMQKQSYKNNKLGAGFDGSQL
jgi:hypothetical protein